jgi:DNA-binding MarR family transcriptional regulator
MSRPGRRRTTIPASVNEAWDIMRELVLDNERRHEVSDALGMSFARIKALRRIDKVPSTMGELATTLGIDRPYMTIVVDDLERQGLVQRKPHPTDRRAKLVETTAQGKEMASKARAILNRPPAELAALPEDQLAALVRGLRAIHPDAPVPVPPGGPGTT